MGGGFLNSITVAAARNSARNHGDGGYDAPYVPRPGRDGNPGSGSMSDAQRQQLEAARSQTSPGTAANVVDQGIAAYNSEFVQRTLMAAPVIYAAGTGAAAAAGGGASAMAMGAFTAAAPVAGTLIVAAGAGFLGFKGGEFIGHHAMQAMGFQPIAGDGEMPATVGHAIAHKSGWSLGALVAGAVAAVAIVAVAALTCGVGLLVIASAAAVFGLGAGFASAAGQYGDNKGVIKTGSPNVFFRGKAVARVMDVVACTEHSESLVAEGAETVFANGWPIARIGHKTTCDGTINDGVPTIAIDMDTHAEMALGIDVGWWARGAELFVIATDWLPIGNRRNRDGDPSTNRDGECPCGTKCGGRDPVDVATGKFMDDRTDLAIPGTIPLQLRRVHAPAAFGVQGVGWAGTWSQHLRINGAVVTFQNDEGSEIDFHAPRDDVDGHNLRFPHLELLGRRSADLFVYDRQRQLFLVFSDEGRAIRRLARIEDRNGNRITLQYGPDGLRRVEHSDGFALRVHSQGGLIRTAALEAADADDCIFSWDYTAAGHLREVRSAQTGTMRYDYDAQGRIIAWHDAKDTHVHYAYGADGRIARTWTDSGHMGGRFDYDLTRRRTVMTADDGSVTVFDWTEDSLVWREIDPLGGAWLTEWDDAYHITATTDPLGHRATFAYDAFGNLIRATDAEGRVTAWEYDALGQMVAQVDPAGNRSQYRHDDRGNLHGITDAQGRVTTLGRGAKGEVLRIDRPGGVQTRIAYDALLRPSRVRNPDGHEVRIGMDTEGRLAWFTDEIGATTRYDLTRGPENPQGGIRRVTQPDGAETVLSWDIEGKLTRIVGPTGVTRIYDFGAFDLPRQTVDGQGNVLRLEHDRDLRLTAMINEMGQRHEFAYDAAGRIIAESDFTGAVTRYERDACGRMVQRIAADGARSEYEWSPAGRLMQTLTISADGQQEVTRYAYDPVGRMTLAENGAARVEYAYDALGRVISDKLNGREITSAYDIAGQRVARSGDVLNLTSAWTKAGLPAQLSIGDHAPLTFRHDPRGLEMMRQSAGGFALAQAHDISGFLAQQIAGPLSVLPPEAQAPGGIGAGQPHELAVRLGALAHRSYDWDRAGRAVAVNDRLLGENAVEYDARGLVAATRRDPVRSDSPVLRSFEYDPSRDIAAVIESGQIVPVETRAGRVRRRGSVTWRHDACGRVIEKRIEEPGFRPRVWTMAWDGNDRMVRLQSPDGATWHYGYDPLGRRVSRHRPGQGGTAWQWEGDTIIAEAPIAADGTADWDAARHWVYEPGSFRPLAQIDGGALHYVVTDHLGTPRELFSEDGTEVAWRAELDLWGEIAQLRLPRHAANDDAPPIDCPIRFQGQWHDAESGLHYNRFRYYDPEAMQYISPDPIGLSGGTRPQGYVDDPNGWIDPLGLEGCPQQIRHNSTPLSQAVMNQRLQDNDLKARGNNYAAALIQNPDGTTSIMVRKNDGTMHAEEIIVGETAGSARILEIFSERSPCHDICKPLLNRYAPGAQITYAVKYRRNSWRELQNILDWFK